MTIFLSPEAMFIGGGGYQGVAPIGSQGMAHQQRAAQQQNPLAAHPVYESNTGQSRGAGMNIAGMATHKRYIQSRASLPVIGGAIHIPRPPNRMPAITMPGMQRMGGTVYGMDHHLRVARLATAGIAQTNAMHLSIKAPKGWRF